MRSVTVNFWKVKLATNNLDENSSTLSGKSKTSKQHQKELSNTLFLYIIKKEKCIYIEKQLLIKNNATNICTGKKNLFYQPITLSIETHGVN